MNQAETITNEDKLACVRRELKMRERAYPRWVLNGRMTADKMNREIDLMRSIVGDYEKMVDQMSLV